MSDLEFIAALIRALAWPVTLLVVLLAFRSAIAELLSREVRRMKAGPVEVEWERAISEAQVELDQPGVQVATIPSGAEGGISEELSKLARESPAAAVMAGHARLEQELRRMLGGRGEERVGAAGLARLARTHGLLSEETVRAVEGVSVLRNLAAHGRTEVTAEQARDYLALVDAVLFALRQPPREAAGGAAASGNG